MRRFDISTIIEMMQPKLFGGSEINAVSRRNGWYTDRSMVPWSSRSLRCCRVLLALGSVWWASQMQAQASFGDTVAQCEAALGLSVVTSTDKILVCAETRAYIKDGISVLVGFDTQGHAEEFVYSKVAGAKTVDLSDSEQKAILEQYRDKSSWNLDHITATGPIWYRADGQAFASYVKPGSRLALLSKEGMQDHIKNLHETR